MVSGGHLAENGLARARGLKYGRTTTNNDNYNKGTSFSFGMWPTALDLLATLYHYEDYENKAQNLLLSDNLSARYHF